MLFKFANEFRSKNPSIAEPMKFDTDDDTYDSFKSFIADKEYTYTTQTEKQLEKLEQQATEEKYYTLLEKELTKLKEAIENTKRADLENNKSELKELLEYEIVKRYFFEKGKIEVGFDDDNDWAKTKEILADNSKYLKLLGKQ
ncbi:hypothetical protein N9I68_02920 [Bacteroidia bacterium]|nr:hypothetical protein [Bacteroidia bacterium]